MAIFKRRYSVGGKGGNSRSNSNTKRKGKSRSNSNTKRKGNSKTRKTFTKVQQQAQKLFPTKAVKEAQQILQDCDTEKDILKFIKKYRYYFAAAVALIAGGVVHRRTVVSVIRTLVSGVAAKGQVSIDWFKRIFETEYETEARHGKEAHPLTSAENLV